VSVRPPNLRSLARIGLAVGAAVAILWGWRELWFLTDEAYIAFRYAHNVLAGRGLAWNPPPFVPVEGHTSFSWVVLLAGTWAATGLDPPLVANVWSLLFGGAGVALGALWVSRLVPDRLSVVAVFLVGVGTSRTYLTWLSSGLETALFNLVILWWLFEALAPGSGIASTRPSRSTWPGSCPPERSARR
jgi:arabinofuranosyltransferase